jgi:O-succinylbenzoate synthase
MKIRTEERVLHFKQPAGTSRGVYTTRKSWLVSISDGAAVGVGECAPLPDLSCDAIPRYGEVLRAFCDAMEKTGELD